MTSKESSLSVLLSLSLFIFILIILAFIILYLFKNKKSFFYDTKIKEMSRYYFTNKNFISIVKIEEKFYILGISENNINKLDEIEDEHFISKIMEERKVDLSSFLKKKQKFDFIYKKIKTKKYEGNKDENSQ